MEELEFENFQDVCVMCWRDIHWSMYANLLASFSRPSKAPVLSALTPSFTYVSKGSLALVGGSSGGMLPMFHGSLTPGRPILT